MAQNQPMCRCTRRTARQHKIGRNERLRRETINKEFAKGNSSCSDGVRVCPECGRRRLLKWERWSRNVFIIIIILRSEQYWQWIVLQEHGNSARQGNRRV